MSIIKSIFQANNKYARKKKKLYCAAIIVAAGSASRMQGTDKIMAKLHGRPVICHAIGAFQECQAIQEIVIVTREDLYAAVKEQCRINAFSKVRAITVGGNDRLESVMAGLRQISSKATHVAVHDGARPLVYPPMIERTVRKAVQTGAAAPAVAVKDTIKVARGSLVMNTPKRSELFAVQTPQIFDRDVLLGALQKASDEKRPVTDDCSAVEMLGMTVHLVEGCEENIKITTPMDMTIAAALLERRENQL